MEARAQLGISRGNRYPSHNKSLVLPVILELVKIVPILIQE